MAKKGNNGLLDIKKPPFSLSSLPILTVSTGFLHPSQPIKNYMNGNKKAEDCSPAFKAI